VIVDIYEQDAH